MWMTAYPSASTSQWRHTPLLPPCFILSKGDLNELTLGAMRRIEERERERFSQPPSE
jgi:hypothetical protein